MTSALRNSGREPQNCCPRIPNRCTARPGLLTEPLPIVLHGVLAGVDLSGDFSITFLRSQPMQNFSQIQITDPSTEHVSSLLSMRRECRALKDFNFSQK